MGLESTAVGDQPSAEEVGVHHALTLFAVHQQSQPTSVHAPGQTFGRAVRILAERGRGERSVHETPVYRRFIAAASAGQLSQLIVHVRGLVGQLRAEKIGFDYVRFAEDLYSMSQPSRRAGVQRRWSRDFHLRPDAAVVDQPEETLTPDLGE